MANFNLSKGFFKTGILCLMIIGYLALGVATLGNPGDVGTGPNILFTEANNAYQKGDFVKAAGLYQKLCDNGYQSGNLYYNLGNAYFKLGAKGRAVLYYLKAKRLIPGDADLKANLSYVLAGVQEGISDWRYDFLKFLVGFASVEQWAIIGSFWFFGLSVLLILGLVAPKRLRDLNSGNLKKWWSGLTVCLAGAFLIIVALGLLTYYDQMQPEAVAVKAGTVRFEPSPKGTFYYHLAEGSRVLILEEKETWVKVKRIDGKRGWVDRACLERI